MVGNSGCVNKALSFYIYKKNKEELLNPESSYFVYSNVVNSIYTVLKSVFLTVHSQVAKI